MEKRAGSGPPSESESIKMAEAIWQNDHEDDRYSEKQFHRVHFLKTAWFKYAAAIILIFGVGAYLWNNLKS